MTIKSKEIHIDDLMLDVDNFRIGHVESEEQAIKEIIAQQKIKLVNLAEHICENGLSPTTLLSVISVKNKREKYLVIDGNRRVCAIKLIHNPGLALGTDLENQFEILHNEYGNSITENILCMEMSLEEARKWRKIDHYRDSTGIGQQSWSALAKARADVSVGIPRHELTILDFAVASNFLTADIKQIARGNNFNLSTLERIVNSGYFHEALKIRIEDKKIISNSSLQWLSEAISKIIAVIVNKEFNGKPFSVRNINTAAEIKDFIDEITNNLKQKYQEVDDWEVDKDNIPTDSPTSTSISSPPVPPENYPPYPLRNQIIPNQYSRRGFRHNQKLNSIFRELKTLNAKKHPVSAAFSFRALLEVSLIFYCRENNIESKNDIWSRSEESLKHMGKNNKISKENSEKIMSQLKGEPLSIIRELNSYVHDPNFHPDYFTLTTRWDNLVKFFDVLWEDLD